MVELPEAVEQVQALQTEVLELLELLQLLVVAEQALTAVELGMAALEALAGLWVRLELMVAQLLENVLAERAALAWSENLLLTVALELPAAQLVEVNRNGLSYCCC